MLDEFAKVIVGQRDVLEELLITVFAGGHNLLEGVPGLAKTLMINTLAQLLSLQFKRIQFTPDLMPSDIVGTNVIEEDHTTGKRVTVFVAGPDLHQHRPGRRNQPHAAQDAGRAAAGDAGKGSHRRRQDLPARRSRSSCWPRRTRSTRKAPIRCPKRRRTASC